MPLQRAPGGAKLGFVGIAEVANMVIHIYKILFSRDFANCTLMANEN